MVPSDYQQQDTYYIVAHFHQVLFGGAIFGLFAGIYYWIPKFTGRLLNEKLGQLHFWLMFIGFNLTFQPMMILGLLGMPRRIATYPEDYGWDLWNAIATVGAFTIALGVLVFMINFIWHLKSGEEAGSDPWDGRTLEWSIPSPPPHYNFAKVPVVHGLDAFWHEKYVEDPKGRPVPIPAGSAVATHDGGHGHDDAHDIHMPAPSYMPLIAAMGLPLIALGLLYSYAIVAVGGIVLVVGLYGWVLEPPDGD
jgi:cytochrome c oxidase subunit 1